MPTYDYYCEKCEKTFEIFQSMNDKKLKKCIDEECNGSVERLLLLVHYVKNVMLKK